MQQKSTTQFTFLRSAISTAMILALLSACGTAPKRTVIPPGDLDLSKIHDAVPEVEPRSKNGNPESYVEMGRRYWVIPNANGYAERGLASWYGPEFHGKRTSNGEPYDMYKMTAAHKTLPLPSYVRVNNLENNRSIIVRVNDRGPFKDGRIIDLSFVAAAKLGILGNGTANVEIHAIDPETWQGESTQVASQTETAGYTRAAALKVETLSPAAPEPQTVVTETVTAGAGTGLSPAETSVSAPVSVIGESKQPALAEPTPATGTYIQVGAFSNLENAERAKSKLESVQSRPVTIEPVQGRYQLLQRVQIGPFASEADASKLKDALIELGFGSYRILNR